jgi:PAS domain S-box-containing protein
MKTLYKIISIFFILILTYHNIKAQFSDFGNPIIKNYLPLDYVASSQNWSIIQDSRGIMYFGNTSCLLEFDGTTWTKLEMPSSTTVRCLDIDKNGTLFLGSIGEFGYLSCNQLGETKYISLIDLLPEEEKTFQNIWRALCVSSGVYFFGQEKIYFYDYQKITVINNVMEAFFGFKAFDNVFVLKKDTGLFVIKNAELIFLPHTENFTSSYRMYNILEYDTDKLLIASRTNGLYTYDLSYFIEKGSYNFKQIDVPENVLQKLNSGVTEYLTVNSLYSSSKINDNTFAFGTVTGGIVITDKNGDIIKIINTNKGLNNNCVYSLFTDNSGSLWAGLQQGISRIDLNYPLNYFNETHNNLVGFVIESLNFNEDLYVTTMIGFYKMSEYIPNVTDDKLQFTKLSIEIGEFWNIYSDGEILLTSGSLGVFQVKNDNLVLLEKGQVNFMYKLKYSDNLFLINNNNELFIYELDKSDINNLTIKKLIQINGINTILSDIVEDKNGSIWLSSTYEGVYRITYSDLNFTDYKVENYNSKNGFATDDYIKVHFIDEKIVFATKKGIYKAIESGDSIKFEHDNSFGAFFTKDSTSAGQIFKYNSEYLISSELYRVGYLAKNKNDSLIWNNKLSKRFPNNYKIGFLTKNEISIYTSDGLYTFDLEEFKDDTTIFNCLIRKVKLKNDSVLFSGNYYDNEVNNDSVYYKFSTTQPVNLIPELNYKNNSLTFEFSALFYEDADFNRYSCFLEGFDDEWSILSPENKAVYTNIPEGKYTFKVKATNVYGEESEIAEYQFSIIPPWHRTLLAYICYIIFAGLFIFGIIKLYTRRLQLQNIELERIVKERTFEIQKQKEEIEQQAHELEKLSIVASETDNAVVIANAHGDFEWINAGFTRLYGYTFDEMLIHLGRNLIETSSNPQIIALIENCINNKVTIIYESKTKTKSGKLCWTQTTITPIVNKIGEVTKLIAIDADISKLKQAEQEILQKNEEITIQKEILEQQNEEIKSQRDELEHQNAKIAFQNEQIKASIRYAKTIQTAMLPVSSNIQEYFEHFILFRPKDIVSGDFYWFSKNNHQNEEYFFVAVIDCTGHGVPGAFMSMISNSLMSEIINESKIFSPKEILKLLDNNIRKALNQAQSMNMDGMDLCMVRIEKKINTEFEIVYSGAKRPLFYYDKNIGNIENLKADRKSIGGTNVKFKVWEFTNQNIILHKEDIIYLSSDGYHDQNDINRKKFGTIKFLEVLNSNVNQPLENQKQLLENTLDNWQKNTEQRDDITVIGIKL